MKLSTTAKALRYMRQNVGTWNGNEEKAHRVLLYLQKRSLRGCAERATGLDRYAETMYM